MKLPIPIKKNSRRFNRLKLGITVALCLSCPTMALSDAQSGKTIAPLKPEMPYLFVVHNGRSIKIERDIFDSYKARANLYGNLVQIAGTCPPFCLLPQQLDIPVETVGETEIIDFMMTKLRNGKGVLLDTRSKKAYESDTIPGSVNYFIQIIQKGLGNKEFEDMLLSLGAERRDEVSALDKILESTGIKDTSMLTDTWDFTEAKELIVWSSSAMNKSSVTAIEKLLAAGYPAEKLKWYRGGLASWQYWGFNTYKQKR